MRRLAAAIFAGAVAEAFAEALRMAEQGAIFLMVAIGVWCAIGSARKFPDQ